MKTPLDGEHVYKDRLRKQPVVKAWKDIDDQVLLKADGWPTYHLAAVVDDHLMGITHVIRAEEWLNSLPKHTWLNQKLGFEVPQYIHVGLLRNADKSKISKRKNPTNILWYRDQGYLPEALLNFLSLLGHSHPDEIEKFDLEELIRIFDIDRLNVAGPVFDMQKLQHIQGQYFRELTDEAKTQAIHDALDIRMADLLPLVGERMIFGGDFTWLSSTFFADTVEQHVEDLVPKKMKVADAAAMLEKFQSLLKKELKKRDFVWDVETLENLVRNFSEEYGFKPKQFFMSLRVAATGSKETPPLFDTLALIGQTKVLERLSLAVRKLKAVRA
ncbi:MAG: hypothetical protein HRU15_20550 [Planctomycetes bacterium]|nr:hypothetical protein [Planctomycetota bacterium]